MTVGPVRAGEALRLERDGNGWRLFGRASRLPWGRDAGRVALIAADPDGRRWWCSATAEAPRCRPRRQYGGRAARHLSSPASGLSGNEVAPAGPGIDRAALYRRGALSRAVLMAGAVERALDMR